jgi:predicted aspartyl protease
VLCDLGASVSVIPKKVFDKLNYSTLTPTSMCLQLANQSVSYPTGIAENIPVKIRNFFILVDFVVLDMQEDMKTPLILGRSFLSTTNAHIDVRAGEIKFHINGNEERFAFKPRPEQCSNLEWSKKQVHPSRSPSPAPKDAPKE